jgi:aminoglycoside phosphotransferase (APT) family kinase protein
MDTDLIQETIAHFDLQVTRVEPVQESYSSIVRILTLDSGARLVLKIPFIQRKLFRELRALQDLKDDLPVPEVVDYWTRDDGGPGALLLSLLPGEVITGAVAPELALALGVLLGKLHTHKLEHFGDVFEPAPEWWGMLERIFQNWQPLCASVMPTDLFHKILDRYAELHATLPEPDGPSWVHFDYRPGNVLVEGTRISGLIDFESSRGGSGDLDFVKIKGEVWDVWPGTRDAFLQGYASVRPLPDIDHTLPFYELQNAFGGVAWCVKRSKPDDPFFYENMQRLKELIYGAT